MKKDFLTTLRQHLKALPKHERDEIIAFYEERFASGLKDGFTEEEIIAQLETPEEIAHNVLAEYGVKASSRTQAPMNLIGLIFMNLFFTWWFLLMMGIISGSMIGAGLFSSGTVLIALFSVSSLGEGLYGLAQLGVTISITFIGFLAFEGLMRFVRWLVEQHFHAFKGTQPNSVKVFLIRLTPSTWLKKNPKLEWFSRGALGLGLLFIGVGTGGALLLADGFEPEPLEAIEETITLQQSSLTLKGSIDDGRFIVERYNGTTVQIVGQHRENQTFAHRLSDDELIITLSSPRFTTNIVLPFFPRSARPEIKVLIPEGITIQDLEVRSRNGLVLIDGIEAQNIDVDTSNGSITVVDSEVADSIRLESSNANMTLNQVRAGVRIDVRTSNGRIQVRDVFSNEHHYQTSNGGVELNEVNSPQQGGARLVVRSSNGSLNLQNVYVLDVRLNTSNGSIQYDNQDRSFFLDFVEANTSNGSTNVNVPRR